MPAGAGHARQGRGRGQKIPEGGRQAAGLPGRNLPGQRTMAGTRIPSVVQRAVDALQRPGAMKEVRVGSALGVRPVIAGEEHHGALVDAHRLELGQDAAHVAVQPGDHRRPALVGAGQVCSAYGP